MGQRYNSVPAVATEQQFQKELVMALAVLVNNIANLEAALKKYKVNLMISQNISKEVGLL